MKKINYANIIHYILVAVLVLTIFLFFTPVLTFDMGEASSPIVYGLTGISLLVNNGKAILISGKNITATLENVFPKSNIIISCFTISYIALVGELVNLSIRKKYNLEIYFNGLVFVSSLTNLILICCLGSSYQLNHFEFNLGYGSALLIVFFILAILASLALIIYPFILKKIKED